MKEQTKNAIRETIKQLENSIKKLEQTKTDLLNLLVNDAGIADDESNPVGTPPPPPGTPQP